MINIKVWRVINCKNFSYKDTHSGRYFVKRSKRANIWLAAKVKSLCKSLDFWGLLIPCIDFHLSSQLDQCSIFRVCLAMCQLSLFVLPFICTRHMLPLHRW